MTREEIPLLGFVGLGAMGGAMARTLLSAGYAVFGYDIFEDRLAAATEAGVTPAESAADVVERTDIILTSLRSSDIFVEMAESVYLPNARPGQIFVDLGTTAAPETRRLASALAEKGARLLDVPVSGGPHGSATGTLRMFAGGDPEAFERCRPILEVLGDEGRVVYCGPSGAGQVVKGVNQLAMGLGVAAYLESIAFSVRGGVDPAAILQAVGDEGGTGWRGYFAQICRGIADGNGESFLVKFPELPYFLSESQERDQPMPLTEALYAFLSAVEPYREDNMGRPIPSFWRELMTRRKED